MVTLKKTARKWKNSWYVKTFQLAKSGACNKKIAEVLGIHLTTFRSEVMRNRALRMALKQARVESGSNARTFQDYVYGRLPDHLKDIWEKIQLVETEPNIIVQVEAMLAQHGERARQHLFIYALINSNFNVSEACRTLNMRRKVFENWVTNDPEFADLVQEIHAAKKDFFESALIGLVKGGDTAAILFANRTVNADRGYNPSKNVKISHEGEVKHTTSVRIKELNLPLRDRKKLLRAYRQRQEKKGS